MVLKAEQISKKFSRISGNTNIFYVRYKKRILSFREGNLQYWKVVPEVVRLHC